MDCVENGDNDCGGVCNEWDRYLPFARAAISAMREPTEEMKAAGARDIAGDTYGMLDDADKAEIAYTAMIDAALK